MQWRGNGATLSQQIKAPKVLFLTYCRDSTLYAFLLVLAAFAFFYFFSLQAQLAGGTLIFVWSRNGELFLSLHPPTTVVHKLLGQKIIGKLSCHQLWRTCFCCQKYTLRTFKQWLVRTVHTSNLTSSISLQLRTCSSCYSGSNAICYSFFTLKNSFQLRSFELPWYSWIVFWW